MQKGMFRKGIVLGIILLFVGASVTPSISGDFFVNNENNKVIKHSKQDIFTANPPEEEWNRTYGGALSDGGVSVLQINDGGFIIMAVYI